MSNDIEFDQFLVEQLKQALENTTHDIGDSTLPPYGFSSQDQRMIQLMQRIHKSQRGKPVLKEDLVSLGLSEEEIASLPLDDLQWHWEEVKPEQGE